MKCINCENFSATPGQERKAICSETKTYVWNYVQTDTIPDNCPLPKVGELKETVEQVEEEKTVTTADSKEEQVHKTDIKSERNNFSQKIRKN